MTVSQTDFIKALLDPTQSAPDGLKDPVGCAAGKRFDVYRNTVISSLMAAMEVAFPVTRKLVGDDIFEAISARYVRIHPPTSPILMHYGETFPVFLDTCEHIKIFPYLADIARIELARRQSYHAPDAAAINPNRLAEIAPEDLVHQRFTLSSAMRLVSSEHPIVAIWELGDAEKVLASNIGGETALLIRPEFDVSVQSITSATYAFLSVLRNVPLGAAYDAALAIDDQFDLPAAIKLLLDRHLIIDMDKHT